MAHVVGVPRRDPCHKCKLPVFLAERLTVGKKVYHRTCLKCARCGSQLTPGSFYETEVDNEYCCETCPDEEVMDIETSASSVLMRNEAKENLASNENVRASVSSKSVRSSIADRLAFFEQGKSNEATSSGAAVAAAGSKLLQRSVTDEEKTKTLQRLETTTTPYKMTTALSNFLHNTVDDREEADLDSEPTSSSDSRRETQITSSEANEEDTEDDLSLETAAPELPKTQSPSSVELQKNELSSSTTPTPTPTKRFTATAQLQLTQPEVKSTEDNESHAMHNVIESPSDSLRDVQSKSSTMTLTNDNANNNAEQGVNPIEAVIEMNLDRTDAKDSSHKLTQKSMQINLELSEANDNDCVTKDETADASTIAAQAPRAEDSDVRLKTELEELESESSTDVETDHPTTVELRRKSIRNEEQPQEKQTTDCKEDAETTERLSVVRARLQQFEVIANNNNDNNNAIATAEEENASILEKGDNLNETIGAKNVPPIPEESVKQQQKVLHTETEPKIMDVDIVTKKTENPEAESLNEVPSIVKTRENEIVVSKPSTLDIDVEMRVGEPPAPQATPIQVEEERVKSPEVSPMKDSSKTDAVDYPEDLNPFKSDDEEDDKQHTVEETERNKENVQKQVITPTKPAQNLNPFDSSDDEIELEKSGLSVSSRRSSGKVPPPRPPPPRISRNPFGDETDEDPNFSRGSSGSSSFTRKTPVPTPRINLSQNPTPEPTPRLSTKTPQTPLSYSQVLQNSSEYYGSANSLSTPPSWHRNSDMRGSNNSLTSSGGGTVRSRKSRRAPAPPPPVKELFPSTETMDNSVSTTPSSSTKGSPRSGRKKRPAPAPPKPARLDSTLQSQLGVSEHEVNGTLPKNSLNYPLQSELDSKLSDEEKALLEGKQLHGDGNVDAMNDKRRANRRLIPLDMSLLEDNDGSKSDDLKYKQQADQMTDGEESQVVYRRMLIPPTLDTPTLEKVSLLESLNAHNAELAQHDRQLEKLKDNKEAKNRNRQSQISASSGAEDTDAAMMYNKSAHGKWKRRKGPAPALPIPPRKVVQMLPLHEIRHELVIIEVQQQGLEKQGVILEKMIRDRCETENGEPLNRHGAIVTDVDSAGGVPVNMKNSKEVEDLILQLFELVNEKNELFRRQAELMYLRRMHRLEQEQADLEYEIRVLMAQPERNKTDTDKAREEALIARLVEVVQLRNEVVDCLEMDRLREAEEDLSIKQRLEIHASQRDETAEGSPKMTTKLSKKEKKKQKEAKKWSKSKKIDADKDADESEIIVEKPKTKKKKRKFLF